MSLLQKRLQSTALVGQSRREGGVWVESLFVMSLLLLLFDNISFGFSLPNATEEVSGLVRPHHLFQILLSITLFQRKSVRLVSRSFNVFFLMSFFFSMVSYGFYGANNQILTFLYCFIIATNAATVAHSVGYEKALYLVRIVFISALLLVILKNMFYIGDIVFSARSGQRVWIPGLVAGGVNPEATALALGSLLFVGSRHFPLYFVTTLLLCLLYSSRGALLVCMFVILIYVFLNPSKSKVFLLALTLMSTLLLVITSPEDGIIGLLLKKITTRFSDFGDDPGSQGRYMLWSSVLELVKRNPFGYGVMNAVPMSELLTGYKQPVIHMHNIYIQCLVDLGIQGLGMYLLLVMSILWSFIKNKKGNLFNVILVGYFLTGMVRYRLYDSYIFVFWGMAIACNKLKAAGAEAERYPPSSVPPRSGRRAEN